MRYSAGVTMVHQRSWSNRSACAVNGPIARPMTTQSAAIAASETTTGATACGERRRRQPIDIAAAHGSTTPMGRTRNARTAKAPAIHNGPG